MPARMGWYVLISGWHAHVFVGMSASPSTPDRTCPRRRGHATRKSAIAWAERVPIERLLLLPDPPRRLRRTGQLDLTGPALFIQLRQEAGHRAGQLAGGRGRPACRKPFGHLVGRAGRMAGASQPALDPADRGRVEQACRASASDTSGLRPRPGRPGGARPIRRGTRVNRKISSEANGEGISPRRVDHPDRAGLDRLEELPQPGQVEVVVAGIRGRSRPRSGSRASAARPGASPWRGAAGARAASASRGSGRGISKARPAFWRNRRPNRALSPSSSRISLRPGRRSGRRTGRAAARPCRAGGSGGRRRRAGRRRRSRAARRSRARRASFSPGGACRPNGVSTARPSLAGRVAERLDQDRPIVGDRAGDADLPGDVIAQPTRAAASSRHSVTRASRRRRDRRAVRRSRGRGAPTASPSSAVRGPLSPRQNGISAGVTLGRRDDHPMRLDRLDPPGGGAQHERLADPPLEDELLVELAEPRPALAEIDRDTGPCRGSSRRRPGPAAPSRAGGAGGCGPGPSVTRARRSRNVSVGNRPETSLQDALERLGGQVAVRIRAADQVEQRRDVPAVHRHAGDDLLGQDVEAAGRARAGLDLAARAWPAPGRPIRAGRRPSWRSAAPC